MGRARRPAVHLGKCLDIFIWDVGHGSAAAARLPNGTAIMLDCGPGSAGFSPVRATLGLWKKIDGLIISHPHMDHTGDISSMPNAGHRVRAGVPGYLAPMPSATAAVATRIQPAGGRPWAALEPRGA